MKAFQDNRTTQTEKTQYILEPHAGTESYSFEPAIVIQQRGSLEMVTLRGEQLLGRPTADSIPDIPVNAPFVSRKHGFFSTKHGDVFYTALGSMNGTFFRGRRLAEGETVRLLDGDTLRIYASRGDQVYTNINIECVLSADSRRTWRDIVQGQYDSLTGLMNRKAFTQWFDNNRMRKTGAEAYFFILDVDRFKQINDTYGHASGDEALVTLSREMESALRSCGKAARWGGDEFVGLIYGDRACAENRMGWLRERLGTTRIKGQFTVKISLGLTSLDRHSGESLDQIVDAADKALYEAKKAGRDRAVFC